MNIDQYNNTFSDVTVDDSTVTTALILIMAFSLGYSLGHAAGEALFTAITSQQQPVVVNVNIYTDSTAETAPTETADETMSDTLSADSDSDCVEAMSDTDSDAVSEKYRKLSMRRSARLAAKKRRRCL